MRGKMIADWKQVDLTCPEGVRRFLEAVQYFLDQPRRAAFRRLNAVQEFTTPGDFPADPVSALARFHQVDEPDLGWEQVFEVIDFTATNKNGFDLVDVSSGLSFRAIAPGEKAEVYKVSGDKITVPFDLYGGALGWSKLWFDDQEYWKIEDAAKEFRTKWYANKAQAHYDLLSASRPDNDVSWQGAVSETKAVRDAETINYACAEILDELKAKGFEVNPNSRFVVVAPVQLMARLRNALNTNLVNSGATELNFNVGLAVTTRLRTQDLSAADTSHYLVVLPGRKLKSGNRMDLTVLSETDILAYAETVAGWGRYGAVVGENGQLRRCATS